MSFPQYQKYKDSGVDWLGEVPQGWGVAPLKRNFRIISGSTPKSDYEPYWGGKIPWVTPADLSKLSGFGIDDSERRITSEGLQSCGTTLVNWGSIILSTRAPIGSLAIAEASLCTNQGCKALVPYTSTFSRFYAYVLMVTQEELNIRGKGTTFLELSGDVLGAFEIPAPSLAEQMAIAAFLDAETAHIDALIAEYETLIDLLKEKRQALISQAVTKGLHPDAPMKDSGVEWLGEVPEGWEVKPMKRYGTIRYGIGEPPQYQSIGVPLIRATNIHAGKLYSEGLVYVDPKDIPGARIVWLQPGDIIVVRSGAYTGDSAIIPPELGESIAGFDMVLRCNDVSAMFVQYSLLSNYLKSAQIDLEKMRAAQPHLNSEELGNCVLLTPPLEEQCAIAAFLDAETARIDVLIKEAENGIRLLRERRTTLISDAVTGKIDVRCVAKTGAPVFVTNNKGGTQ